MSTVDLSQLKTVLCAVPSVTSYQTSHYFGNILTCSDQFWRRVELSWVEYNTCIYVINNICTIIANAAITQHSNIHQLTGVDLWWCLYFPYHSIPNGQTVKKKHNRQHMHWNLLFFRANFLVWNKNTQRSEVRVCTQTD